MAPCLKLIFPQGPKGPSRASRRIRCHPVRNYFPPRARRPLKCQLKASLAPVTKAWKYANIHRSPESLILAMSRNDLHRIMYSFDKVSKLCFPPLVDLRPGRNSTNPPAFNCCYDSNNNTFSRNCLIKVVFSLTSPRFASSIQTLQACRSLLLKNSFLTSKTDK